MTLDSSLTTKPPPETPGFPGVPAGAPPPAAGPPTAPRLSLTDFLDVRTLQEVQDSFAALTRLSTGIRDADGRDLTSPTDPAAGNHFAHALPWSVTDQVEPGGDGSLSVPIVLEGQKLGSIVIRSRESAAAAQVGRARLLEVAHGLGVGVDQAHALVDAALECCGPDKTASVQFLYLLANSIARLCYQEYQLRQRAEELSALFKLSTAMAGQRDVQPVLDTAARLTAEVMKVKAVMIRLLDENTGELVARAVHNLSDAYLDKGPILAAQSEIFQASLTEQVVYVPDMQADPRIQYPADARREGLVSMLLTGMVYQGRPIGALQLYTGQWRRFSPFEIALLKAAARFLGAAIEKARLDAAVAEGQQLQRQLRMATEVQKRMLPHALPHLPPFEIAARYVPSFELGGDFYDFIDLGGNLGVAVGDVVGKGIAASLLMAAVRASLRAYAQDVYDIDEIMVRVNVALTRDTLANEFATLFYGVLDPRTRRLTYCNAGHEPPLLLRRGEFIRLDVGGMIVGVEMDQQYDKAVLHLQPGDLLLIYTDGLPDAQNFAQQRFGRERVMAALREAADQSAHGALQHVLWEMRRFVGLNHSVDDTTIVVVKCVG